MTFWLFVGTWAVVCAWPVRRLYDLHKTGRAV